MMFYILRLKVCGIKNIEKPVEFSFYKKTIANDFNPENYRIKAIYGENGSGKTAIIYSMKILQNILLNGSYLADNDTQKALSGIINKKTKKGQIECEIYVDLNDFQGILLYNVQFELRNDDRLYITSEKLLHKNGKYTKNKYSPVFITENGILTDLMDKSQFEFVKEKTLNLLDKQSMPTCIINNMDAIEKLRNTESFFYYIVLIMFSLYVYVSIDNEDNHINYILRDKIRKFDDRELSKEERKTFRKLTDRVFDSVGDERLVLKDNFKKYERMVSRMADFIKIFKSDLLRIDIEKKDYDKHYRCNLKMVYENYSLDCEFESRGIKKLMDLFVYLDMASNGRIVFIDELDSNINDVYLDKLIEYFIYYGKGQLCFTSHNLSPMSVLKGCKSSISFISSVNTVQTWTSCGNLSPERAYKNGFIEDSPFNVDPSDFLGILGESDE